MDKPYPVTQIASRCVITGYKLIMQCILGAMGLPVSRALHCGSLLQVVVHTAVILVLCAGVTECLCVFEAANDVYNECNPLLADISSAILALTGGSNYTIVCRYFSSYVHCMTPTFQCSEFVNEFLTNYDAYRASPFNCRPNVSLSRYLSPAGGGKGADQGGRRALEWGHYDEGDAGHQYTGSTTGIHVDTLVILICLAAVVVIHTLRGRNT